MSVDLYESAFRSLHADRNLVIRFFAIVSRFEYAAKLKGYRRENRLDLMVAWQKLGEELDSTNESYSSPAVQEAIRYLTTIPPKTLDKEMNWVPKGLDGKDDLARALDAVVRIRNNLFHGRKGDDSDRNNQLFTTSLDLIEAIMSEKQEIREAFIREY